MDEDQIPEETVATPPKPKNAKSQIAEPSAPKKKSAITKRKINTSEDEDSESDGEEYEDAMSDGEQERNSKRPNIQKVAAKKQLHFESPKPKPKSTRPLTLGSGQPTFSEANSESDEDTGKKTPNKKASKTPVAASKVPRTTFTCRKLIDIILDGAMFKKNAIRLPKTDSGMVDLYDASAIYGVIKQVLEIAKQKVTLITVTRSNSRVGMQVSHGRF